MGQAAMRLVRQRSGLQLSSGRAVHLDLPVRILADRWQVTLSLADIQDVLAMPHNPMQPQAFISVQGRNQSGRDRWACGGGAGHR